MNNVTFLGSMLILVSIALFLLSLYAVGACLQNRRFSRELKEYSRQRENLYELSQALRQADHLRSTASVATQIDNMLNGYKTPPNVRAMMDAQEAIDARPVRQVGTAYRKHTSKAVVKQRTVDAPIGSFLQGPAYINIFFDSMTEAESYAALINGSTENFSLAQPDAVVTNINSYDQWLADDSKTYAEYKQRFNNDFIQRK